MRRRQKFLLFRVYRFRDTGAYGELYDFYVTKIRRFIAFRVSTIQDAEELTAEVFLRGWEYATSSVIENPGALFYRIARNVVADHYRSRKESEGLEAAEHVSASDRLISEEVALKQEQQQLINQLKDLKEEYRDALVMRYLDEMSVSEIAQALEKTPNNVRVLLHRAKKALKDIATT